MNKEISVGEYIKTKGGHIRKVKEIEKFNEDYIYVLDKEVSNCNYIFADYIKDQSPNIIDLIEVGDYVNGHKVSAVDTLYNTKKKFLILDVDSDSECAYEEEIKTILTKEQFEKITYEV